MMTPGFGRDPASQRPGLFLIPDAAAEFPAPVVDLASLSELKERIRLPVLLTIPLMVFILPSLMIVIGTPLALRIIDMMAGGP